MASEARGVFGYPSLPGANYYPGGMKSIGGGGKNLSIPIRRIRITRVRSSFYCSFENEN